MFYATNSNFHILASLKFSTYSSCEMASTAETQITKGLATVLAIGTANPENILIQNEFPDYYFDVTNCMHAVELKEKVKRICQKSMISKRHKYPIEELLSVDPQVLDKNYPSFNIRMEYDVKKLPELAAAAATKAIEEWGQPKSSITHLICHSYSAISMPGWDYELVSRLGLETNIKRIMLYHTGCYGGGAVLRISKDIAENNFSSRVLVVCSELMGNAFHKPTSITSDNLVAHSIFSEGAAALIVGANPIPKDENPIFELYSTHQDILPDSKYFISGKFGYDGFKASLGTGAALTIANNIEKIMAWSFNSLGISDWNSLFWVVHPGGAAILKAIEEKLGLTRDKLNASHYVLKEYGNMSSPSVLFVLDEMRKRSLYKGKTTTGEGLKWGVLLAMGPGITVEAIVLRSFGQ